MYQFAYRMAGNNADAEDLVQGVLTKLFPKTADMQKIDALRPWLLRVLYRHFIDEVRKSSRSVHDIRLREENRDGNYIDELPSHSAGPAEQMTALRQASNINHALAALNDDQRALVALHLIEGHTLQEVADILDTPVGTLKSRLSRAKAKLKILLAMEPFAPL